ncbi:DUF397 domain-containing protein [Streptomonospora sp. S1-112]|uniref:DUF397 domain-containing protein n=1 Tax=Streptomonospora mangrovi TaxID=2883123 RepID=A0A9X3NKJ5_9ACTN|nr:DUF397 domain-containing protein [Streptomonospora mangrovi]MDA0563761.1 DUF397 domain-containing protein [Streptomonospora mangrovi]
MKDFSWHTSSFSAPDNANCVEVREHMAGADVRDSQNRGAGHLEIPAAEWTAFLVAVKSFNL